MPAMARIPTTNTLPERTLRAALQRLNAGRIVAHDTALPGSPDLALPECRIAAFAHGCFWHNHTGCRCARVPATSFDWAGKFARNRTRDDTVRAALLDKGWRVVWVWECALVGPRALADAEIDARLTAFIAGRGWFAELAGRTA